MNDHRLNKADRASGPPRRQAAKPCQIQAGHAPALIWRGVENSRSFGCFVATLIKLVADTRTADQNVVPA
ncbi:hypothetical protein, partial [Salinisphaera sp.]|uniref:hypothetical protein n=1 Tax=Salinisphaera sp. TaxID=1914330 RepID=UPI002D780590